MQIPAWSIQALRIGRIVVFIGILLFTIQLGTHFAYNILQKHASDSRYTTYLKLRDLNQKINTVDAQIQATFANEDLLYMKFGSPPPEDDLRTLGFGGKINPDSQFVRQVHPIRALGHEVTERARHIYRQIIRSDSSYDFIAEQMNQQYTKWRHIPSVSPCNGRYSSPFGPRTHPVTGERNKMHYGIDLSNRRWTPIYAPADGRVSLVRNSEYFGNYVVLDHGNGYITKYGHMEKPIVKLGQFVKRYQVLGYMGRTGRTTGVHLHYEVWKHGSPIDPINFVLPAFSSVE